MSITYWSFAMGRGESWGQGVCWWRESCKSSDSLGNFGKWRDFTDEASSIHNLGLVGHIEDIAVTKDQQGKKLGLRIIEALDYVAAKVGCYKVRHLFSFASSNFATPEG